MSFPLRAAVVLVAAASLTGCHKAPVHVLAPVPSLNVPVPDTRLVIPSPPVEAPVEVQAPPDPPPVSAPPPRTRESSPSVRRSRRPTRRRPPHPPASEASSPVLQTTAKVVEQENRARALLTNAERDLARIQPRTLTPDGLVQFNNAQQFIRQARAALDREELSCSPSNLADKAATLATMLVKGRTDPAESTSS